MALIRCLNCGKEISDTTKKCIHCGSKIAKKKVIKKKQQEFKQKKNRISKNKTKNKNNKQFIKIGIIIITICLITLGLLIIIQQYNLHKTYQVTFENGNKITIVKVKNNEKVEQIKITREGYKFDGWYLDNKKYNFNKKVTSNLTLKAKWIKKYTVTFDSSGGTEVKNQEVLKGEKVIKPTNPKREGFEFINWYVDENVYDFNKKVKSNIKLVAKWKEKEIQQQNNSSNNISSQEKDNHSNSNQIPSTNNESSLPSACYHFHYFVKNDVEQVEGGVVKVNDYISLKGTFGTDISFSLQTDNPDIVIIGGNNFVRFTKPGKVTIFVVFSGCENVTVQYPFTVEE